MKFVLLEADKRPVIYQKILPNYTDDPKAFEWLVDDVHQISPKNSMWIVRSYLDHMSKLHTRLEIEDTLEEFSKRHWRQRDTDHVTPTRDGYYYIVDWLSNRQRTGDNTLLDFKTLTAEQALKKAKEWHDSLKASGAISKEEKGEVILKFNDGFYWINLLTNKCTDESEAMGHCGQAGPGEELLSLRKKSGMGVQPHVTAAVSRSIGSGWILHQMKGKQNAKPVKEYHKYIVDLLMLTKPINIQRYQSGYRPDLDFNLADLSFSNFEKVSLVKPTLVKDFNCFENAVKNNNLEVLKHLLKIHLKENIISVKEGHGAIRAAAKQGNVEMIKLLVAHDFEPEKTLLETAASYNQLEVVKYLIEEKGFDPQYPMNTPLLGALSGQASLKLVKYLLEAGADPNFGKIDKPLMELLKGSMALPEGMEGFDIDEVRQYKFDATKLLIEYGVDIHHNDEEALRYVSERDYPEILKLLIENGANARINGDICLLHACRSILIENVKILLKVGVDPNARDGRAFREVIMGAENRDAASLVRTEGQGNLFKDCLKILEALVEAGGDVTLNKDAALNDALFSGYHDIVYFMLDNGASPNKHEGRTAPLEIALKNEDRVMAKELRSQGASLDEVGVSILSVTDIGLLQEAEFSDEEIEAAHERVEKGRARRF